MSLRIKVDFLITLVMIRSNIWTSINFNNNIFRYYIMDMKRSYSKKKAPLREQGQDTIR